jgi:hypothetical protein
VLTCPVGSVTLMQSSLTFPCANSILWRPVECTTVDWVWSSRRLDPPTLEQAAFHRVLYTGEQHASDNRDGLCSLDGAGWVSTQVFTMSGCNTSFLHIGGRFTGNCSGHDGDQIRRLVVAPNACFDYRLIPTNGQGGS